MNSVIPSYTLFPPHLLERSQYYSQFTALPSSSPMAGRKRKADSADPDDRMSTSPTASPSTSSRALPSHAPALGPRSSKRSRTLSAVGRPLELPRLLETLSASDLRNILTQVCISHPTLVAEVTSTAPRPSLDATLAVLSRYETVFKESFPFGNRPTSEYTYLRVRAPMLALLEALKDFTPQFLPPQETQPAVSLSYLDAVTSIVHRLPDWDSGPAANRAKDEAYEELSAAWVCALKEAEKRGGGAQLRFGGWDAKIRAHDHTSGGRLAAAVEQLTRAVGWFNAGGQGQQAAPRSASPAMSTGLDDRDRVRQQLMSGTYGSQVGVGNW